MKIYIVRGCLAQNPDIEKAFNSKLKADYYIMENGLEDDTWIEEIEVE